MRSAARGSLCPNKPRAELPGRRERQAALAEQENKMASLPLPALYQQDLLPASKPAPIVGTAATPVARLSALEWSIVAMAERDGIGSIREAGRYTRAIR